MRRRAAWPADDLAGDHPLVRFGTRGPTREARGFLPGGTRSSATAHVTGHETAGRAHHPQQSNMDLVPELDIFLPRLSHRKSFFQHEPAHGVVALLVCRMQLRFFVIVITGVSFFPVGLDAD